MPTQRLYFYLQALSFFFLLSLCHMSGGQGADEAEIIAQLEHVTYELDDATDLDPLLERIGKARYVLLGEASHGTSEYYLWRARLSERLILEKGFTLIAVEGDWPSLYEVNRYLKGEETAGRNAYEVLHALTRWPTWMWANWEMVAFVEWLQQHNETAGKEGVGFYGIDVYGLWEALGVVLAYAEAHAPEALDAAQEAHTCFAPYKEDELAYARAVAASEDASCEDKASALLEQLQLVAQDDSEAYFNAEQNALVVLNAERYYRATLTGGPTSWNLRDHHMMDSIDRLVAHHGPEAKIIVWEHNSHIGDARATTMARSGLVNVGQLARERHGEDVVLVGFGSHRGSVIAATAWGASMQRMEVPEAQAGSWEDLFHRAGEHDRLLIMEDVADTTAFFEARDHRAIGVVYQPHYEQFSNYVPTVLPERYDAFIYLEESQALHPLHLAPDDNDNSEAPLLYPWGF